MFSARNRARTVKPFAAVPYVQLPELMVKVRSRNSISARALEFTILTACRTGEVFGAKWSEIDLKTKT